jgi:hypothetical protein
LEPSSSVGLNLVRIGNAFARFALKIEKIPRLFDFTVEFFFPILGAENFRERCSFGLVYRAVSVRELA